MREGTKPDTPAIYTSDPNEHILFWEQLHWDCMFSIISWHVKESNYSNDNVGNIIDLFLIYYNLTCLIS